MEPFMDIINPPSLQQSRKGKKNIGQDGDCAVLKHILHVHLDPLLADFGLLFEFDYD